MYNHTGNKLFTVNVYFIIVMWVHLKILDENRTLLVSLPEGHNETLLQYPVLYILYGGQVWEYFAESVHIVDQILIIHFYLYITWLHAWYWCPSV